MSSKPVEPRRHARPATVVLLAGLASALVAGAGGTAEPASPANGEGCPAAPELWQGQEEELRLGGHAYRLLVTRSDPGDGRRLKLAFDLAIRLHDPESGEVRLTTQPSGIAGTWSWSGGDGGSARGALSERVSEQGSSLGFERTLPLPVPAGAYRIVFELDRSAPVAGGCVGEPLTLRYELDGAELAALEPRPVSGTPALRSPGDNQRVNVLGQIDLRNFEDSSDIWGYSDGVTHLAILGSRGGTLFIDVTDPATPTQVGFILGPPSSWRDIKTYGHYAYIVTEGAGSGEGMQIVDLADPFDPRLVGTYATNFATTHNLWIDQERGHAWLVGTNNGARIVSLEPDPESPVEIGAFTDRYVHDVYVKDDIAYFAEIYDGLHEIVDATFPDNLRILSSWSTPSHFTHNSWPNADFTLLGTTDEATAGHLSVYDVDDKESPATLLGEYEPNPAAIIHNVIFDDVPGNRVAISHYALGFKYVDLQRPTIPVELGSYDTYPNAENGFRGAWGVYPFDPRGYFYVSDIQSGLWVLEYAPSGGTFTGRVSDAVDGASIAGAEIQVLTQGRNLYANANGEFGEYSDPGEMVLRIKAPGYLTRILDAGTLEVDGGLDLEIALERLPLATLSGTVRRSGDLAPLAQAQVNVLDTNVGAVTDGSGAFTLVDVPVGQRVLAVDAVGYSGKDATLTVQLGENAPLDVLLDAASFGDDLEQDLGWTAGGDDTATLGFWVREDPIGSGNGAVQPEDDHTPAPGVAAWVTGQGFSGLPPEFGDVDGGTTRVLSPVLDLSAAANPSLRYYRWFSSQSAELDGGSFRIELSDDAGASWTTVELLTQDANSWTPVSVPIADHVALTDQFQARFSCEAIASFDTSRVLECAFDDVSVVEECRTRVSLGGGDGDGDGVLDPCDVCPLDATNDVDGDGICGNSDNAPFLANPDQADLDADGVGDVADNCVDTPNVGQSDLDRDGDGDACDDDQDGDGVDDAADPDRDGDGVENAADLCPDLPDSAQPDRDGNGIGDRCDAGDGVVQGLRVDGDVISWTAENGAGSYNVYRGDLGAEVLLELATCRASGVPGTIHVESEAPQLGDGYLYLVAPVIAGTEGDLAAKSDGSPRILAETCP